MPPVDQNLASLIKARSLLIILLATCRQTLTALEAASNVLDTELAADLSLLIARSESELDALAGRIDQLAT